MTTWFDESDGDKPLFTSGDTDHEYKKGEQFSFPSYSVVYNIVQVEVLTAANKIVKGYVIYFDTNFCGVETKRRIPGRKCLFNSKQAKTKRSPVTCFQRLFVRPTGGPTKRAMAASLRSNATAVLDRMIVQDYKKKKKKRSRIRKLHHLSI